MITRGSLIFSVQLPLLVFVPWSASSTLPFGLPEVISYAKVSRNENGNHKTSFTADDVDQGRGFRDSVISRSPVYVPSKTSKLRNGEAVDHPSTVKYSTLDREAVAKLDASNSRHQAQDRFHPPASFEHTIAHSNAVRQQSSSSATSAGSTDPQFPVPSYATLPRDAYSPNYSYQPDSKPINDPPPASSSDDYSPDSGDSFSKIPDSYQKPEIYQGDPGEDSPKFSGFASTSSFGNKYPPKPVEFPDQYDHPTFVDDPYLHHHHDDHEYPHDLIYDHPPDDHFHDHPTTTTEEPEMNDQRLSKRPYSYYYIGKKLWYLPLYFSIYFIFYIAALVLKSITRHKINFPASLAAVAANARHGDDWEGPSWFGLTKKVLDGIDTYNSIGPTKTTHKS